LVAMTASNCSVVVTHVVFSPFYTYNIACWGVDVKVNVVK